MPIPVRQRVAEAEAGKRGPQPEGESSQAKFVRFDPNTEIPEPSPKQQRTALYSPTFAGNLSSSPADASTSRHVRRVVDELELYNEDELDIAFPEESCDWEFCEETFELDENKVAMTKEEQGKHGFYDEGAGPPNVSPEELSWRDAEAMQLELVRLRKLDVIGTVGADVNIDQCVRLDTRLV